MEKNSRKGNKRKIACVIAGILAAAVAAAVITHPKAAYMVFKNLTAKKLRLDKQAEWSGGNAYLYVPYAQDSESQYLDLYVPDGEEEPPLFVFIHGGGFIYGDSQTRQTIFMYQYFRDHGFACATIGYRLAQEAAFPAAVEDVKAAVRFLQSHAAEYGYNAEHIAVFGESAGGYLACMEAFTDETEFMGVRYIGQEEDEKAGRSYDAKADVLIDYYGAVDLGKIWSGESDWDALEVPQLVIDIANSWIDQKTLEGFSSVESYWLRKEFTEMTTEEYQDSDPHFYMHENLGKTVNPAVMIVHGDCDITVPSLQSQRLYDELKGLIGEERAKLLMIPGEGHATDMLYSDEVLKQVEAFITKNLG